MIITYNYEIYNQQLSIRINYEYLTKNEIS